METLPEQTYDIPHTEAKLDTLSPEAREHIVEFVMNRGDYATHLRRLIHLSGDNRGGYVFVVEYYLAPELSISGLERVYNMWACGREPESSPKLGGEYITLSEPRFVSALQRWATGKEARAHQHSRESH